MQKIFQLHVRWIFKGNALEVWTYPFGKGITIPTNIEVEKICYVTFFLFYLIVCIELCLRTANAIACCTLIDKSLLLYIADIGIY